MADQIQYPYALDEDNNLIFIGNVVKEHRYEHVYHCPNCGGEMLPRLGEHNAHCFAHTGNQRCSGESYLHKAAKLILARRFNERSKPFKIGLTSERPCAKLGACQEVSYNCRLNPEYKEYDLMESYDLPAEVEVDILEPDGETHFTPDALLRSSSPKRADIFIEVYYKHRVTKEKKKSGHQIIEIRVRELADLKALEDTECFKESVDIVFYNFKSRKVTPEQIESTIRQRAEENGYRNYDGSLPPCKQSRKTKRQQSHLRRLTLFKSGKMFNEGILEDERGTHRPSALMDITYEAELGAEQYVLLSVLAKNDLRARACYMCDHCINYNDMVTWCNIGKNGTTRKGSFDPKKGTRCKYFEWHHFISRQVDSFIENENEYVVWINPDE